MDDTRCKYINKTCLNARSVKENGELHRLCTFHRAKAVDAQRRWHSRRRNVGTNNGGKRRVDNDEGGGDDAPPLPSPKRRQVGAPELPALAEVMMMLRQREPVPQHETVSAAYATTDSTSWPAPPPGHARYYEEAPRVEYHDYEYDDDAHRAYYEQRAEATERYQASERYQATEADAEYYHAHNTSETATGAHDRSDAPAL